MASSVSPGSAKSAAAADATASAPFSFHAHGAAECVAQLESDAVQGLSSEHAAALLARLGPNELEQQRRESWLEKFCDQFDDFLVKILIVSALISFVLALVNDYGKDGASAFIEPLVIVAILILNAGMGVYQEMNAQGAMDRLKQMQSETSRVVRDGVLHASLPSSVLVPGDVVELHAGDRVPADCRLLRLKSTTLRTNESCLTGESSEVEKSVAACASAECDLSERSCELFSGTTVSVGSCRCLVVRTGMQTEMGGIQRGLLRSAEEDKKTPLSEKLDEFGEVLAKIIGAICILVWLVNIRNFKDPIHGGVVRGAIYYLKIAVSLGVAAIPEGLPAVITLCLSLGSSRMARKNCIVRKLPSVETLGCTTVICSDKTGTLTTNRMVVQRLLHFGSSDGVLEEHHVSGTDYDPRGAVEGVSTARLASGSVLDRVSQIGSLCSADTSVQWDAAQRSFTCSGSPTEASLRVLSEKLGNWMVSPSSGRGGEPSFVPCDPVCQSWEQKYDRQLTLEFTSERKRMSVLCRLRDGPASSSLLLGKGAPELILEECDRLMLSDGRVVSMSAAARKLVQEAIQRLASESLRTLALFEKRETSDLQRFVSDPSAEAPSVIPLLPEQFPSFERQLTFCGLVGIRDPPRPEVFDSIRRCQEAGIRVMMITGDNEVTACAIAREIGIFGASESDADVRAKSFNGKAFMALPLNRQLDLLRGSGGRVFSRTEPSHKQHLVSLLRDLHEVVAMTGDGVNDAPALSNADIGVAMGISGTEVAKEAAAMVLADDNFATIVSAVEEGRAIYQNTKAFIRYLISSNIGEVVSVFLTAVAGLPEALIPVQLLWVNLVTDGPPATALGFNPVDPMAMREAPRGRNEPLITPWILFRYVVIGCYVGLATVGIFVYWYIYDTWGAAADGHTLIGWHELLNWSECPNWTSFRVNDFKGVSLSGNGCDYFGPGKETASTLSLTVLVTIEMLNALNAISENNSLLSIPIWSNRNLLLAVCSSFALHFCILYIPVLNVMFQVDPLTVREWLLVLLFSLPVILIEEVLKFFSRRYHLH